MFRFNFLKVIRFSTDKEAMASIPLVPISGNYFELGYKDYRPINALLFDDIDTEK